MIQKQRRIDGGKNMPTYVEVETLDGAAYHWVTDDEVISKLIEVLGAPEVEE